MNTARLTILCTLTLSLLAATDPFVGTWKLNTKRSKFAPGAPSFILGAIQIESAGNGLKSTASGADGQGISSDFTFSCPARRNSMHGNASDYPNEKSFGRGYDHSEAHRSEYHHGHGYKEWQTGLLGPARLSADGKTMTVVRDGTTPVGNNQITRIYLERLP